jgi:predicted ATP-grasp superfamily ATP-dependent carboligase
LVKKIGYYGYANPEFKYDERDKQIKLMEINGRISMSNSHALRCGQNVIKSLYNEALNGPIHAKTLFQDNCFGKILWWVPITDFLSAYNMFRNGNLSLVEYFKSFRGKGFIAEPINIHDPAVFLNEMKLEFRRLLSMIKISK